jgi:hypothetical protein
MIENSIFQLDNSFVSLDTFASQKNASFLASNSLLATNKTAQILPVATDEIINAEQIISQSNTDLERTRSTDLMSGTINPANQDVLDPLIGDSFKQQTAAMAGDPLLAGGDLQTIATQVLSEHGSNLQKTFTSTDEWQHFLSDVFATNSKFQDLSPDQLVALRDGFGSGSLRPEIKFVAPDVLLDAQGISRSAAFDGNTILLANNLDRAGIADGIKHELGHWWDTLLNGTTDTIAKDGQAFDEGEAYAERFGAGVMPMPGSSTSSDFQFSTGVYQDDHSQVYLDGQETPVEFRPIATWNMNGARHNNGADTTWEQVFKIMNNPGQNGQDGQPLEPINIMALQETGLFSVNLNPPDPFDANDPFPAPTRLADIPITIDGIVVNVAHFSLKRELSNFDVYLLTTQLTTSSRNNVAIVLRNAPPLTNNDVILIKNPRVPAGTVLDVNRPMLGVRVGGSYYFTQHAQSGFIGDGSNNDAEELVIASESITRANPIASSLAVNVLGDFNRNLNDIGDPFPNLTQRGYELIRPDAQTYNARLSPSVNKLDGLIRRPSLAEVIPIGPQPEIFGTTLNQLPNANAPGFPSDHFPVVFDDFEESFPRESFTEATPIIDRGLTVGNNLLSYTFPTNDPQAVNIESGGTSVELGEGRLARDIVGVVQSDFSTQVYYKDGTVTRTPLSSDQTNQAGQEYKYTLATNKKPENIVGIDDLDPFSDIAPFSNIVYYSDGTGSIGGGVTNRERIGDDEATSASFELSSKTTFEYTLPSGKTSDDIVEVAVDKNDHAFAFYDDGTFSEGTIYDLDAYQGPELFALSVNAFLVAGVSIDPDGRLSIFKIN